MDTLNWLTNEISNIFSSLVWSAFTWASIFGLLGFISSIFMVRFLNKRGYFQRANKVWTFVAKINLVYLPLILPIYFAAMGAIFGVHQTTNTWIEKTTEPVAAYAVAFVPAIQELGTHLNTQLTLEEALTQELAKGQIVTSNSWEQEMQTQYNNAIVTTLLDEFGYPHEVDGLIRLLREQNLSELNASFFASIPSAIQDYCGYYFWMAYGYVWAVFFPFFLISLAEFGAHFLYQKGTAKLQIINYTPKHDIKKQAA